MNKVCQELQEYIWFIKLNKALFDSNPSHHTKDYIIDC